jgi:hypothetical protein
VGVTHRTPITGLSSAQQAEVIEAKAKMPWPNEHLLWYVTKTTPLPVTADDKMQKVTSVTRDGISFTTARDATPDQRRSVLKAALVAEAIRLRTMSGARASSSNAQHLVEEIDINDFPLPVRQALTNRKELAMIMEQTQTSITPRGVHVEKNAKGISIAPPNQRKLHLSIEGTSAEKVRQAKSLLMAKMNDVKDELGPTFQPALMSRYKVVS